MTAPVDIDATANTNILAFTTSTDDPKPAPHVIRWWLRLTGFGGITLPPFGIFILAERLGNERLVRHEAAHWAQYKRMGFLGFYLTYLYYSLRHGYWNNPMEIEARKAENGLSDSV